MLGTRQESIPSARGECPESKSSRPLANIRGWICLAADLGDNARELYKYAVPGTWKDYLFVHTQPVRTIAGTDIGLVDDLVLPNLESGGSAKGPATCRRYCSEGGLSPTIRCDTVNTRLFVENKATRPGQRLLEVVEV
jgi:hypothetical protein